VIPAPDLRNIRNDCRTLQSGSRRTACIVNVVPAKWATFLLRVERIKNINELVGEKVADQPVG